MPDKLKLIPSITLKGFTFSELIIAMIIISLVLIGSFSLTTKFSRDREWQRLQFLLEEWFREINVMALAQASKSRWNRDQIPDQYHLYFHTGEDPSFWYLESLPLPPVLPEEGTPKGQNRTVVYQEKIDLDSASLRLSSIILRENTEDSGGITGDQALLTFSQPFASLRFHMTSQLHRGDTFAQTFLLRQNSCERPKCSLVFEFSSPGESIKRQFIIE